MKLIIFSVRDSALNAFLRPFYVPAVGAAVRGFSDEVNRKDSEMFKHPEDYELFEMGTFDEESGDFELLDKPRSVGRAKDVLISVN